MVWALGKRSTAASGPSLWQVLGTRRQEPLLSPPAWSVVWGTPGPSPCPEVPPRPCPFCRRFRGWGPRCLAHLCSTPLATEASPEQPVYRPPPPAAPPSAAVPALPGGRALSCRVLSPAAQSRNEWTRAPGGLGPALPPPGHSAAWPPGTSSFSPGGLAWGSPPAARGARLLEGRGLGSGGCVFA